MCTYPRNVYICLASRSLYPVSVPAPHTMYHPSSLLLVMQASSTTAFQFLLDKFRPKPAEKSERYSRGREQLFQCNIDLPAALETFSSNCGIASSLSLTRRDRYSSCVPRSRPYCACLTKTKLGCKIKGL